MPKIRITGRKLPAAQDGADVEGPFFLGPEGKPQVKMLPNVTVRSASAVNGKYFVPGFGYVTPEDLQDIKYRVEMSPGYNPDISWREQTGLAFENSLLDRLGRGANMVFSDEMAGVKPLQWARNIMFAPGAGAVSLARSLSGEDMVSTKEAMGKAAPWDVSGLGMIPHAAKAAEEFVQNPGVLTGIGAVANTVAALPVVGSVESSPLKISAANSVSRGTAILPEIGSKRYWFPSGKVTATGVLKTPLRVLPFGQTTKAAVKEFVAPIPKGVSSEMVGAAVRGKAANLIGQATHPTFSLVENVAAAPYRTMTSAVNPALRKAGVEITEAASVPVLGPVSPFVRGEMIGEQEIGRRPTSYLEEGADALDALYMPTQEPPARQMKTSPGTTYYREPSASGNIDSLEALKRELEAAGLTGQKAYGGMTGTKELPHLFRYRAGIPLRWAQVGIETEEEDKTPINCEDINKDLMQDPNDPNRCIPKPNASLVTKPIKKPLSNTPPQGYAKDYGTMKFTPIIDNSQLSNGTGGVNVWDSNLGNTDIQGKLINDASIAMPKQTVVNTDGTTTTTGSVDIGQPTLYQTDPNQTKEVGLFKPVKQKSKGNFWDKLEKFNRGVDNFINPVSAVANYIDNYKQQKKWNKQWRENAFDLSTASSTFKGNFDPNTGYFQPDKLGFKNTMYGRYGGSLNDNTMDTIRIRLLGGPVEDQPDEMAYGGQLGYGLDLGQRNTYTSMPKTKSEEVSNTIKEVPRSQANIEAEKGETVYADMDGDGMEEHFNIGGQRHTNGGTPLNVPDGSFVFSDTKKMTIKDPKILEKFGLTARKEGYTPAEIAKRYDVNKYKAIAEDPVQDGMSRNTAIIMIKNYQRKLAELAIIQERMKGFPQGIPEMAMKVLSPEMLQEIQAEIQELKANEEADQGAQYDLNGAPIDTEQFMEDLPEMEEEPEMGEYPEEMEYAYGGDYDLDSYQKGGEQDWRRKRRILEKMNALGTSLGAQIGYSKRYEEGDFMIPEKQAAQSSGLYGDINAADVQDFKKRHKWYFSSIADPDKWNPATKADVEDFQAAYNQYAKQLGFDQDYFVKDSGEFDDLDGLFGEFTYNTPSLDLVPTTPTTPGSVIGWLCSNNQVVSKQYASEAERDAAGAKADMKDPSFANCKITPGKSVIEEKPKTPVPFKYMTPDIWKMSQVRGRRINKYLPFIADVPYEPNQFTPEEWRAKAAELQSQTGDMARTLGAYGSTSALGAGLSALAGAQGRNLVSAIADTDARNVAGWNAFTGREQARKDQFNALRAANQTERWKGNVIANQQYDNALNRQAEDIVNADTNAWTNRMELGMMNETNKFYYVDPRTGRMVWKGGYGPQDLGQSTASVNYDNMAQDWQKAQTALPGITYDQWLKMRGAKYGGSTNKRTLGEMLFHGYGFPF